jgi:hypothetical protein
MIFHFEPRSTGGLKVIPDIPSESPCLIEGRNGIGKTVAIRLLQLISGQQPFPERGQERLWRSLAERLGPTRVTIAGLEGGETLRFTFTPERWPADPPAAMDEWLGEAVIGDRDATVAEASRLLWITRIAGNEDLEVTLQGRLRTVAAHLQVSQAKADDVRNELERVLGPIRDELVGADPQQIIDLREELEKSELSRDGLAKEAELALDRQEALARATSLNNQLAAIRDPDSRVAAERKELQAELRKLEAARKSARETLEESAKELRQQGDVQFAVTEAESLLRRRRKRALNLASEIDQRAMRLAVRADEKVVRAAFAEARDRIGGLTVRRRELDTGEMVRSLIERLDPPLRAAAGDGLDDERLVEDESSPLTVAQVRGGIHRRLRALREQPLPSEVRRLDEEIAAARRRASGLDGLIERLGQARRQAELVADATTELQRANERAATAGAHDEKYESESAALTSLEEQIAQVTHRIALVNSQLGLVGERSEHDLERDLAAALEELKLEPAASLEELLARARHEAMDTERRLTTAASYVASLRRNVTVREADFERVLDGIREDPRFGWLRARKPSLVEQLSTDDAPMAFSQLRAAVIRLDELINGAADTIQSLADVTSDLEFGRQGGLAAESGVPAAVERVLSESLREGLNTDQIRRAIFDGAEVIEVDLGARDLVLAAEEGAIRRPLDAFSSGEQTFAFTQARIRQLEPPGRPNSLLVLDEFGAFVSAERLPALADFLASEDVRKVADQVLVILPLQVDYAAEVGQTTGRLQERYAERAKQIQERDYCAVPLEP